MPAPTNEQDQQKLFEKGLSLFSKQEYQESLLYFEQLTLSSFDVMKNYYIGLVYVKLDQFETALEYYRKILEIPRSFQGVEYDKIMYGLYINMGSVLQVLAKRQQNGKKYYKDAQRCYEFALEIKDNDERVWNNLGNIFLELKKYDKAIQSFKKAIELDDEFPEAYYCLSLAYEYTGNYKLAIEQLKTELKWRNRNKIVLNRLTGLLFGTGKFNEAKQYATKMLEYYPENVNALKNLVLICYNLEKYEEAKQYYSKILEIQPDFDPGDGDAIFEDLKKK